VEVEMEMEAFCPQDRGSKPAQPNPGEDSSRRLLLKTPPEDSS